MIGRVCAVVLLLLSWAAPARAGLFDDIGRFLRSESRDRQAGDDQVAAGLREALAIGAANAVSLTSKVDGYFANQAIRILLPERLRKAAGVLRKAGFGREVDEFVLSMNRAAEKAAPQAREFFAEAIREMTFDDARKILAGGDTAATEFLREKTRKKIYDAFRPVVSASMDDVGVTRSYKKMMAVYGNIPFVGAAEAPDLDSHVAGKAIDGLFHMLGQEERKIRTDPAARVTDLLKTVFGGR